jgi:hypothetical protein
MQEPILVRRTEFKTYPIFLYPVYKILLVGILSVMDDKSLKATSSLGLNLKL